jgi:hypothetical protein
MKVIEPYSLNERDPQKALLVKFVNDFKAKYGAAADQTAGHATDVMTLIKASLENTSGPLTPKLEQIFRAFEFTQIELAVYRQRGYAQGSGASQPEADRCALACAFLAKAVLDLKNTRALIDLLQADSKLLHLCGFDLRFALPSEATFSRAFDEFPSCELMQRVHALMIEDTLGEQLDGHISRDSTAIEARESIEKKDKTEVALAKPQNKRGRPPKGEVRPAQSPSPLVLQRSQTLKQMLFELDTACATGTKKKAQEYKISWKGYKLHLNTACCGVPISAVFTGANVHDSRVSLPLLRISAQRVDSMATSGMSGTRIAPPVAVLIRKVIPTAISDDRTTECVQLKRANLIDVALS